MKIKVTNFPKANILLAGKNFVSIIVSFFIYLQNVYLFNNLYKKELINLLINSFFMLVGRKNEKGV